MKKKLIQLSVITSLALITLNASTINPITNWSKYPLPQEVVSKSKGGTLADKDAMKDGVGSVLIKSINGNEITLDNKQYNQLLLLNKDKLTDTIGLKELIVSGDIVIDVSTLNNINSNSLSNPTGLPLGSSLPVDGTVCDDNNLQTINDKYVSGVCVGTSVPNGSTCDDGNVATTGETYLNGVCQGGIIANGTACDDGNPSTPFDFYKDGVCVGTIANNTCDGGYYGNPYVGNIRCYSKTYSGGIPNGFLGLKKVSGYFYFYANYNMNNVDNLINLTDITGNVYFMSNTGLTSFNGLRNLTHIGGTLHLYDTPLGDFSPMCNLKVDGLIYLNRSIPATTKCPANSVMCTQNTFSGVYGLKSDVCY